MACSVMLCRSSAEPFVYHHSGGGRVSFFFFVAQGDRIEFGEENICTTFCFVNNREEQKDRIEISRKLCYRLGSGKAI